MGILWELAEQGVNNAAGRAALTTTRIARNVTNQFSGEGESVGR